MAASAQLRDPGSPIVKIQDQRQSQRESRSRTIADKFEDAAAAAASMLRELADREPTRDPAAFRTLRGRVAALPLSENEFSLFANVIADVENLVADGEFWAAAWQLRQTIRRLERIAFDWLDERDSVRKRNLPVRL